VLGSVAAIGGVVTGGSLVEHDVLPGRSRAYDLLGLTGEAGVVPDVEPGPRREGVVSSDRVAQDPHYVVSYPPGTTPGDALPVVVALHGAGRTAEAWFDELSVDAFLAASGHRFAVAAVDGGLRSYWHERVDDQDPGAMVREEFLPVLADLGLDAAEPPFLGWSMGGLGALRLSAEVGTPVLAVSPALWPSYDQALPEAFDTEEQYDASMALARRALAEDARVDCGTGDPFYRDVREVLDGIDVEQHYERGAHDAAYWTRVLPEQLDWLAERVSAG
jgi:enterochelin esterase-like enzyme